VAAVIRAFGVVALCAVNLRTVLAALGAGGSELENILGGGANLGAASTVSILLIAAAAPLAVWLAQRMTTRTVIAAALAATVIAHGLLVTSTALSIWIAIVIAGVAAGLIGALLPAVIRALTPRSPGLSTGVMMAANSAGLLLASLAVAASIEFTGSWTYGPAVLAAVAGACLAGWLIAPEPKQLERAAAGATGIRSALRIPWVLPLTAYLGAQSFVLFAQIAWLVPSLESAGVSSLTAGQLLGVFTSLQLLSGIGAPFVAQRWGGAGALLVGAAVIATTGTAVLLWLSADATEAGPLLLASAIVLALGHGAAFALANYIIAARSDSVDASVRNAGAVMLISQALGALGPLAFGVLRDFSGDYRMPWWMLVAAGLVQLSLGVLTARRLRAVAGTSASGDATARAVGRSA
jgi:CP family cyanate transporter-like MFS transporter